MKKLILLSPVLLFTLCGYCQLDKGQWLVGGMGSFASSNNTSSGPSFIDQYKITMLQAQAGGGYFIFDKFAVGLRGGIATDKDQFAGASELQNNTTLAYASLEKTTSYSAGPFARYYLLNKGSKINILVDGSISYNGNKNQTATASTTTSSNVGGNTSSSSVSETTTHDISYTAMAGPVLFLNKFASLELTAGYTFAKVATNEYEGNYFLVSAGFQIHLGK